MTDFNHILDGGNAASWGTPNYKWTFVNYSQVQSGDSSPETYRWDVNPNTGGSPTVEKNIEYAQNVGPYRVGIVQEGQSKTPLIAFSGIILTQSHYETLERWFDKRVLIKLTDDLGRQFFGVFSKFAPVRARRASSPWYHTYDAEFSVAAYINASGDPVYGRTA